MKQARKTETPANEATTYESVRSYLHGALEQLLAAGRSTYELVDFAVDKFGHSVVPHLTRFQQEIREGQVNVKHLADAAKTAVFGVQVTEEQREQMIREAAYFRAARRGFAEGDSAQDWIVAEKEIDALLEKQAGVVGRARKALTAAVSIAEQEVAQAKDAVTAWIASKHKSAPARKGR